jgi:transcriptional regulator with XRE-family HTH domain
LKKKRPRLHLRELRERRHLSIRELSDRSGVAAAMIARLEHGEMEAKADALDRLAAALGVSLEDLTGEPAPEAE